MKQSVFGSGIRMSTFRTKFRVILKLGNITKVSQKDDFFYVLHSPISNIVKCFSFFKLKLV